MYNSTHGCSNNKADINGSGSLQAQFESWGAYPDKAETKLREDTALKVGSEPYKIL